MATPETTAESYDSRPDTYDHIGRVRGYLLRCATSLIERAHVHDASKLAEPEKSAYDRISQNIAGLTYGSDEYRAVLRAEKPAIQHHYGVNDHHPEFFGSIGIAGMNLLQLTEMLCDWKAASERHDDGDIYHSIEINADRFGYGEAVKRLLRNTAVDLGWT